MTRPARWAIQVKVRVHANADEQVVDSNLEAIAARDLVLTPESFGHERLDDGLLGSPERLWTGIGRLVLQPRLEERLASWCHARLVVRVETLDRQVIPHGAQRSAFGWAARYAASAS